MTSKEGCIYQVKKACIRRLITGDPLNIPEEEKEKILRSGKQLPVIPSKAEGITLEELAELDLDGVLELDEQRISKCGVANKPEEQKTCTGYAPGGPFN